jgi:hypothetical protein
LPNPQCPTKKKLKYEKLWYERTWPRIVESIDPKTFAYSPNVRLVLEEDGDLEVY